MAKKKNKLQRFFRIFLTLLLIAGGMYFLIKCEPVNHFLASFFSRPIEKVDEEGWKRTCFNEEDSIAFHAQTVDSLLSLPHKAPVLVDANNQRIVRPILGVKSYEEEFPDLNDVQLSTAMRLGIPKQADRAAVEKMKGEMTYIGGAKTYQVTELDFSVPYLVPRASRLLDVLAQAFADSLQTKGLEPHQFIVSSVTRTEADVKRLRRGNVNASENSCHQYGTTVDIKYNEFYCVSTKGKVQDERLKCILAEVFRDQRALGTCYVKYERLQPCFHFTAR